MQHPPVHDGPEHCRGFWDAAVFAALADTHAGTPQGGFVINDGGTIVVVSVWPPVSIGRQVGILGHEFICVANTVGFLKGKSAIRIHREYLGRQLNFTGFHFWAKGYCVSTVGIEEQTIRDYIRKQEEEEIREEQLRLQLAPRGPSQDS